MSAGTSRISIALLVLASLTGLAAAGCTYDPPKGLATPDAAHAGPAHPADGAAGGTVGGKAVDGGASLPGAQMDAPPAACPQGGCATPCQEGASRCSDKVAQTCTKGTWVAKETCAYVCLNGGCTGECVPDVDKSCGSNNNPRRCDKEGRWEPLPACGGGTPVCRAGACVCDKMACGGACVDPMSDGAHCGSCGTACGADRACLNGSCQLSCGAGKTKCGTSCIVMGACCSAEKDCEPPRIVASSPTEKANGVDKDVRIVVEFSEKMNRDSVRAAYSSAALSYASTNWAWEPAANGVGERLTIKPVGPLAYDKDVARAYTISIGDGATDLAGNKLSPWSLTFYTFRRSETTLPHVPGLSGSYQTKGGSVLRTLELLGPEFGPQKAFVTFDLGKLPARSRVEQASVRLYQDYSEFFTSRGPSVYDAGPVVLQHVRFPAVDAAAFEVAPFRKVGVVAYEFREPAGGWFGVDATAAITEDLEKRLERLDRSQFRLEFERPASGPEAWANFQSMDNVPYVNVEFLQP